MEEGLKKDACITTGLHSIKQSYKLTTRVSEKQLTPHEMP